MICSHWSLVMLFNYIRDTFGNMFVNTKPSRILPHVTLHESCRSLVARYRLSIEGVRKGIPCPWPQALLGFLFLPKSEHSSLTAPWESGNLPSKQEKIGRKQPYLGVRRQQLLATVCSWGQKCSRESCTHQLSLSLGCRNRQLHPQAKICWETCMQILFQLSGGWTTLNFLGSPRPVAFQHFQPRPK